MAFLVSVHTPKTAGTSFRVWLEKVYGKERVYLDYIMDMDPGGFLAYRDGYPYLEGKKVVHGHFWVNKYQYLKDAVRITVLRDPVERAISHYFFWQKTPHHGNNLHSYFLNNRLSIEQFCSLPVIQNIYTTYFFRDVDMDIFDFVGEYNALKNEMLRLSKILGVDDIMLPVVNTNPNVFYKRKVQVIMRNQGLLNKLRDLLSDDIRFYEKYAGR